MSFLVLLLAVWVEKFSALRQRVQRDAPWLYQLGRLESNPRTAKRPWWILTLTVLLPLLVLALVLVIVGSVAYGWLALPIHLLVLIYSLGRGDIKAKLGSFRDACRRGDQEAAVLVADRDLGVRAAVRSRRPGPGTRGPSIRSGRGPLGVRGCLRARPAGLLPPAGGRPGHAGARRGRRGVAGARPGPSHSWGRPPPGHGGVGRATHSAPRVRAVGTRVGAASGRRRAGRAALWRVDLSDLRPGLPRRERQ
mgnify:CR=1 FL=1